jgi:hypothetical protein
VAELARQIAGARLETIEAGHLIHDAEPEAFTRTALAFLRPEQAAWMEIDSAEVLTGYRRSKLQR